MRQTKDNQWRKPRPIVERIIIKGKLKLLSPAHFGSGDVDPFSHVDMLLLRDPLENRALLPGASIAGALRNYLRERELGYRVPEKKTSLTTQLFGLSKGATEGAQSPLMVDDALADKAAFVELRDGVAINPQTRTAKEGAKFDLEVLAAGTEFLLAFELVIEAPNKREELTTALALALQGLENGDIHLGARKQRGLGQVKALEWQVWDYNLTESDGLLHWLAAEQPDMAPPPTPQTGPQIAPLLAAKTTTDQRHYFKMTATFALKGALLIRSSFGYDKNGPDTIHLHGRQTADPADLPAPIIPGSSFAGVIRHRALRIAKTLGRADAEALINDMFGCSDEAAPRQLKASRVRIGDAVIENITSLVQNRIRIDRFTGGAHATALFAEQPVWGGADSALTLAVTLINPQDWEIGLLLQVLKDLWVSDLAVGGSSSVGRGRLQGVTADLILQRPKQDKPETWRIVRQQRQLNTEDQLDRLNIEGDRDRLESFAQALSQHGGSA